MDVILLSVKLQLAISYTEDGIIFFQSPQQQFLHTEEVLSLLMIAGMTLKLKKYHFFCKPIDYLGLIAPGKRQVALKPTEAFSALRYPTTVSRMRSF